MKIDSTYTLHRIDVKDQLPREGSTVLCWGHQKSCGWRWIDVLTFEDGHFTDSHADDYADFTEDVTHWASLVPLNWNDGIPLHRSYIQ